MAVSSSTAAGAGWSSGRPSPTLASGRRAARRGGRSAGHLHLPARPARAGGPARGRAVHRPVANLPAAICRPSCRRRPDLPGLTVRPLRDAAGRRGGQPASTPATAWSPRRSRCWSTTRRTADFSTWSPRTRTGRDRRHRHRRRPRRGLRRPGAAATSLWCLTVDGQHRAARHRRQALIAELAERLRRQRAARSSTCRCWPTTPARSGSTSGSASTASRCSASSGRTRSTRRCSRPSTRRVRRAQPVRADHRGRGRAPRHPRRGHRPGLGRAAADARRPQPWSPASRCRS